MTTNQYYYDSKNNTITSEQAHALKDKTGLVVADKAFTKTALTTLRTKIFDTEEVA